MPNVPNFPGVPALSSYISSSLVLDTAVSIVLSGGFQTSRWGIYTQDGTPVITTALSPLLGLGQLANTFQQVGVLLGQQSTLNQLTGGFLELFSIVDFEYKQDWTLSEYQVEQGAFQSYDKVQLPFDVRMRVAAGGSEANRASLLTTVEGIANSIELYNVATPEEFYLNCNVSHYDYKRTAINGVGLLVVDIWLTEIRVTSTSSFSNTQTPGTAGQQALGNVQALPQIPAATSQLVTSTIVPTGVNGGTSW